MKPVHEHLPEKLAENIRFTWIRCIVPTLIICLPLALMLGQWVRPKAYKKYNRKTAELIMGMEHRPPAPLPSLPASKSEWAAFPEAMDKYLSDYFPLRTTLVRLHSELKYDLGITPNSQVILGRNGWLFYSPEESDIRGFSKLPGNMPATLAYLNQLQDELSKRGVIFLVLIAPNKSSIYPEMLPPGLESASGRRRMDDWIEYLRREGCRAPIVDLRQVLRAKKTMGTIYFKTDTHWNTMGSEIATQEILNQLKARGIAVTPTEPAPKDFVIQSGPGGDLSRMGGLNLTDDQVTFPRKVKADAIQENSTLKGIFPDSNWQYSTNVNPSLGPMLMIQDSFGDFLRAPFSEIFSPSLYVFTAISMPVAEVVAAADKYKLKVVLLERVERNLIAPPAP